MPLGDSAEEARVKDQAVVRLWGRALGAVWEWMCWSQGQSPVINYVGPEHWATSSWCPSSSPRRSGEPRALSLPPVLLSERQAGWGGREPDPLRTR